MVTRVTLPRNPLAQWEPTKREVDKRLTKRFFEGDLRKGKSENRRVFTADLNGGPGWT